MTTTPAATARRSSNLPREPADYAGLTRGPRRAWWRPLLSLLLLPCCWVAVIALPALTAVTVARIRGLTLPEISALADPARSPASGILINGLGLVALVPAVVLATSLAHRLPPGFVHSVVGRVRWRWFAKITLCLIPVVAIPIAITRALGFTGVHPEPQWLLLLLIALIVLPLQSAGEEYVFRGWVPQNLGSWFGNRRLAWVLSTATGAGFFAVGHRATDPWVLADLVIFATTMALVTWRTGGLEAAVALHALNNLLVTGSAAVLGGLQQGLITANITGGPGLLLVTVPTELIGLLVVFWAARRYGIDRMSTPASAGEPGVRLGQRPG